MSIRKFTFVSATAALLATAAVAQSTGDAVIDTITGALAREGYSYMEVKRSRNRIRVEAKGEAGEIERVYDREGNMVREERGDENDNRSAKAGYDDDHGKDDDHGDDGDGHDNGDDHGDDGDDHDSGDDHDDDSSDDDSSDDDGGDDDDSNDD
ncbi:hypothetical protein [Actibacterium sp. D379-3]